MGLLMHSLINEKSLCNYREFLEREFKEGMEAA